MRGFGATVLVAVGTLVATLGGSGPAAASGGGGCGAAMTEANGSIVEIRRFCFTPTVLHVSPGSDVTFVNRDAVPHNVLGANGAWGSFKELRRGAPATYRFGDPGTFSYACVYHPGMVGTVVVGDGTGRDAAIRPISSTTDLTPVASVAEAAPKRSEPEGSGWQVATAIAVSLLVLTVGAAAAQRRHLVDRR